METLEIEGAPAVIRRPSDALARGLCYLTEDRKLRGLLLAKTMLSEPRILLVDEPTRGIDIGTKQQIYAFLRDLAAKGHAVVVTPENAEDYYFPDSPF